MAWAKTICTACVVAMVYSRIVCNERPTEIICHSNEGCKWFEGHCYSNSSFNESAISAVPTTSPTMRCPVYSLTDHYDTDYFNINYDYYGYKLRQSGRYNRENTFRVNVSGEQPASYPCAVDIYWELRFGPRDCYKTGCDQTGDVLKAIGLDIDKKDGWLRMNGYRDTNHSMIALNVNWSDCGGVRIQETHCAGCVIYERELSKDEEIANCLDIIDDISCSDSCAIFGNLRIVNASSQCQPNCADDYHNDVLNAREIPIYLIYDYSKDTNCGFPYIPVTRKGGNRLLGNLWRTSPLLCISLIIGCILAAGIVLFGAIRVLNGCRKKKQIESDKEKMSEGYQEQLDMSYTNTISINAEK